MGVAKIFLFLVKNNPETVSSSTVGAAAVRRAFIFYFLGALETSFILLAISASSFLLNCDNMFSVKKIKRMISTGMKACLLGAGNGKYQYKFLRLWARILRL